jgi:dolichyl-phosphate-mannose--protein O-mannosyl transferase
MALLAVFPLEVMTSTLFAVDIPLATYSYTAFWLYRVACDRTVGSSARMAAAVASGVVLFVGYSAKQWALLIGVLFAI